MIAVAGAAILLSHVERERSAIEQELIRTARVDNTDRKTDQVWSERGPVIYRNIHPVFHTDGTASVFVEQVQTGSMIWGSCRAVVEMKKGPEGWRVTAAPELPCSAPLAPILILRRQYFQPVATM